MNNKIFTCIAVITMVWISYNCTSSDHANRLATLQSITSAPIYEASTKTIIVLSRQSLSGETVEEYTYYKNSKTYTKETGNAHNGIIFEGSGAIECSAHEFNNAKNLAQFKNQQRG